MKQDTYSLHTVTFKPSTYRDDSSFKHPSETSNLKFKRWNISAKFRDDDFIEGETHPDDEFVEREDVGFTEWRKKGEDFDPCGFLIKLLDNFETLAKQDKGINEACRNLIYFAGKYGNCMNDNICDDYLVDTIARFGKMYRLPTLNVLPFKVARDRYYDQTYLFYSTCKLIIALFDIKHWNNVLGDDVENFKSKNFEIIIDEES